MKKKMQLRDKIGLAIRAHRNGNFHVSKKSMNQNLRRARKVGIDAEIEVLKPYAFMFFERQELQRSKKMFLEILDLMAQNPQKNYDSDRVNIYSVMALIANAEDDRAEAIRLDELALGIATTTGQLETVVELNGMLATYAMEEERFDDAIRYYERTLENMNCHKHYSGRVKQLESILIFLYGKCGQKDKRNELRKKALKAQVESFLNDKPLQEPSPQPKPPMWGQDHVGDFLETSTRNTEATFMLCRPSFDLLVERDAQFRLMNDLISGYLAQRVRHLYPDEDKKLLKVQDSDWLEVYFFQQAHSSFLAAARLAMSGQVPQAQMVLRGLLENSMYCFRVHHNPHLKSIWLNRATNPTPVKANFKTGQIWEDFATHASAIKPRIFGLYNKTVDDGAHPNANAFFQNAEKAVRDGALSLSTNYLNPKEIERCLEDLIACAEVALEIFDSVFDTMD